MPCDWTQMTTAWPSTPLMHYTPVRGVTHWCCTLQSGVFPTKFGGQSAFLSNLTRDLPRLTSTCPSNPAIDYSLVRGLPIKLCANWAFLSNMTPGWPLHDLSPVMHNSLVRGSFYQISKAIWPLDDIEPLVGSLQKYALKPRGPVTYHANFQFDTSKNAETHSRTCILTNFHTYIQTWIS